MVSSVTDDTHLAVTVPAHAAGAFDVDVAYVFDAVNTRKTLAGGFTWT
jgi:hypothetical protein